MALILLTYSAGLKAEPITFTDNAAGGPQSVSLDSAGSGIAFSPDSLSWGSVAVGDTSGTKSLSLTNNQTTALSISSIVLGPDFIETATTCPAAPASLAAGDLCTVTVAFRPESTGAKSESITFTDNAANSPQSVPLTSTGVAGSVLFSPGALTFAAVAPDKVSPSQAATLTNETSASLSLTAITVSGHFAQTNNCPGMLGAGASCAVAVTSNPTASGTFTGSVNVKDSTGSTTLLYLSGSGTTSGTGAGIAFSPDSLSWGSVAVGDTSGTKSLSLTNNQTTALSISSIVLGPDFIETATTCPAAPASLAAGDLCTVTVAFRPESTGAKSESITFTDNAANSPQSVPLTSTGVAGSVLFSPGALTFAAVAPDKVSPSQAATLTNETSASLSLTAITVSGHFAQTNNCPGMLGAGASCAVAVTSNPTASGTFTGSVNVKDSTGSTTLLYLSGSGTTSGTGSVTLSPSSYAFPNEVSGTSSGPVGFTLANNQSATLAISSIAISNPVFSETNNCGSDPAAGVSCTISVTFAPQSSGTQSGTLSVNDNASGSPQTVSLTGTGTTPGSSNVTLSPGSYSFPTQGAGTVSSPVAFTLTNGQSGALAISSISISTTDFSQTNNCGSSLGTGASCTISVEFTPQSSSVQSATLSVNDNAGGSPQTASLTGNTTTATVKVKPENVAFGPQLLGRPSDPQSVTVSNSTSSPVTISAITSTGSAFSVTNTCIPTGSSSGTLAGGSSCSISVIFDPTTAGSLTGSVAITTSSPSGGISIPLAGTGEVGDTAPSIVITPQASCVLPGATQQFASEVRNTSNTSVNWYVNSIKGGDSSYGTISTGGLYVAPSSAGTFVVEAVDSAADLSKTTTIDVTTSPTFEIYPYTSSLPFGGQQTFQAQICNVPDSNATFTVDNIAGGNATVGTITGDGVYTAPNTAGQHTVRATDSTLNKTSGAIVTVFSKITVDFGSRTNTQYPIRAGILGVNHVDGLHDPADMSLIAQAGVTLSRTYANIATVYATQTPDWTKIDPLITKLQAQGMHVLLEVAFTPPWLQPNPNPCGSGSTSVVPTNINSWAQIAASYVAHMDASFPGVVTDYEIENEPNANGLCGTSNKLNSYLAIYAAAAPLMKQQAATDGATIRVGGPASAGLDSAWISALLSNSSTAPYVDFVSYHDYLLATAGVDAAWDTYNGNPTLYDVTQSAAGATYAAASKLVAAGQQPGGATTPIYDDEYNVNSAYVQNCCQNDPTYSPVWNALYVSDLLDQIYYTGTAAVPQQMGYFAGNAYPYFCMIGTWDTDMDCQYTTNSTPVPYPQYYAYQLMGSPDYLGMNSGGYMAASISPAFAAGGIETTAFYTPKQDSILIVNPTATEYSQITITVENSGFSSPSANLYQIVNGNQINSSSVTLTPSGSEYTVTISVPAYTVMGISIQGS